MDSICFLICYPSHSSDHHAFASNGRLTHRFVPTTVLVKHNVGGVAGARTRYNFLSHRTGSLKIRKVSLLRLSLGVSHMEVKYVSCTSFCRVVEHLFRMLKRRYKITSSLQIVKKRDLNSEHEAPPSLGNSWYCVLSRK
jgi:hypothetical protein